MNYLPQTGITYGLLRGLDNRESHELLIRLEHMQRHTVSPMLLPILLVELRSESIGQKVNGCHKAVGDIKYFTGIHALHELPQHSERSRQLKPEDAKAVTELSRELTRNAAKLAQIENNCEVHISMLKFITKAMGMCFKATPRERKDVLAQADGLSKSMAAFMTSSLISVKGRSNYLSKRAQSYVQTVSDKISWILLRTKSGAGL
jgi:hypothetical protein